MDFTQCCCLGHEIIGIVSECSNIFMVGKEVAINPIIPCEDCRYCKSWQTQLCTNISAIGRNIDGGFAEYVKTPIKNLHLLPEGFNSKLWVLCDSMAVVIHGLNLISERITNKELRIAIIGDGTLWLLSAMYLSETHTEKIIIFWKNKSKLVEDILGDECHTPDEYEDEVFDLVIEAVGWKQTETLDTAIRLVKRGWTILLFGVYPIGFKEGINLRTLFYKEIQLQGANSFWINKGNSEFESAIQSLFINQNRFGKLLSDPCPLSKFKEKMKETSNKYIKTVYFPD